MEYGALNDKEKVKRGCIYCKHVKKVKGFYDKLCFSCPFSECPYKELDSYNTYGDYLADQNYGGVLDE